VGLAIDAGIIGSRHRTAPVCSPGWGQQETSFPPIAGKIARTLPVIAPGPWKALLRPIPIAAVQHDLVALADQQPRLHETEASEEPVMNIFAMTFSQDSISSKGQVSFVARSCSCSQRLIVDRWTARCRATCSDGTVFLHRFMQLHFQLPLIVLHCIGQQLCQIRPC